ncbi:MAG: beta-ketodecanoyl-[acyl-carrier-protein] synthase [bacterium]|jgi:beta-ketodecanoyl-[acyl-carrier-protein] synthase
MAQIITGTGLYTPKESISNDELVAAFNEYVSGYNEKHKVEIEAGEVEALQESSSGFILKASGIENRYVMNKSGILDPEIMAPRIPERTNDEPSLQCEMAVVAAKEALAKANKTPADVDAVFVACSNMQRSYPAISVEVQNALGIDGFAFDMNVACSSATFGLQIAIDSIKSGNSKCILVVNPEICTGHLNFRDRDCHFIFGDACTAMVIEDEDTCSVSEGFRVHGTKLKTKFSNNIRNNFGFMNNSAPEQKDASDKLFVQHGRSVFKEVIPMVAKTIKEHLSTLNIQPDQVKRFWLHQANLSMNQLIAKKVLGRVAEKHEAPVILNEYANTSSAGSIIAFHKYQDDFQEGELGVICSFGAGYSVGNVVVEKVKL